MEMGLSFDDAQSDPNMMRLEASAQARAARRHSQDAWPAAVRGAALTRVSPRAQMRNQLRKYAEGRNKSAGTVAREAFERNRRSSGVTVREPCSPVCVCCVAVSSRLLGLAQLGERSSRPSASQYSMQDLEISNDTSDSFGGACRAAARCWSGLTLRCRCVLPAAIAKRVVGLLVVGVIGGAVLFKIGLSAFQ